MDFYLGQISTYGFSFAPRGWSFANGSLLPIAQYSALFSLLGSTYGGNGQTNFALPDLRSRVAMHAPSAGGNYALGEVGGEENVILMMGQMPMHTHSFAATNANADKPSGAGHVFGGANHATPPTPLMGYGNPPNTPLAAGMISVSGSSLPHGNIQPYLALNYCIALTGTYPSRN